MTIVLDIDHVADLETFVVVMVKGDKLFVVESKTAKPIAAVAFLRNFENQFSFSGIDGKFGS